MTDIYPTISIASKKVVLVSDRVYDFNVLIGCTFTRALSEPTLFFILSGDYVLVVLALLNA